MEQVLTSDEIGRDEQSTLGLLRKLDVRMLMYISMDQCTYVCNFIKLICLDI